MIQVFPGSSGLAPDSLDGSFGEWWHQATELMHLFFSNSPEPPPFHLQNCLVLSSKLRAYMSQGQADILDSGAGPPSGPSETDAKSCYPDEAAESKVMDVSEFVEEVVSCFPNLSEESVAETAFSSGHCSYDNYYLASS